MNLNKDKPRGAVASMPLRLLEGLTVVVLALVPAALVWLTLVAYLPSWCRLSSLDWEVYIVLLLLTAAVLLVSVLALLQTWASDSKPADEGQR
jgi:hypothetical protein